jgi:hypothetical protein
MHGHGKGRNSGSRCGENESSGEFHFCFSLKSAEKLRNRTP